MSFGQTTKPANRSYPATLWVPCEGARTVRSSQLVAKATHYSANVKVVRKPDSCEHTTTLTILRPGTENIVYIEGPIRQVDELDGNGMNLVDWSPDGRMLAVEFWRWVQAPNDAGIDERIWVVRADHQPVLSVDLDRFLEDQKGKSCYLGFDLMGFTPEGEVVLRVNITQDYDVDETPADVPAEKRCVEKHEVWAVDAATQHHRPLPADYQGARYSETVTTRRK